MKKFNLETEEIVVFLAKRLKSPKGLAIEDIQQKFRVSQDYAKLLLGIMKELFFITEYLDENNVPIFTLLENVNGAEISNIPKKYNGKIAALTRQEAIKYNRVAWDTLKKQTDVFEMFKELLRDVLRLIILVGIGYLVIHFLPV